ncbi:DND1 protein, partial [Climacteris rufus]|nr:DND1 protein [Climacteris rufus]
QCPLPPQMWTNSINQARKMALLAWQEETGIKLVQINGQRRYGGPPPGWEGGPPPAGTEVYIGRLPQDVYEDTLIPLFRRAGQLYEFRLMMTFSGLNRGFAYAKYSCPQGARSAIATLNGFELREGCAIVVCRSTQKRELSVDGLAASVSRQELEALLRMATEGILCVTLHASPCHSQAKLAVLKYESHQAAALAKKALVEGNVRLGAAGIRVDWLHPKLKQKLQLWEQTPPPSRMHGEQSLAAPRQVAVPVMLQNVLDRLNSLCHNNHLRTPLFMMKRVQVKPGGWQQFMYRVVIPGCPMTIRGSLWVSQERQGWSAEEEVKLEVAMQALRVLSEFL